MSDRFPPLRPQAPIPHKARPSGRAVSAPAPVDLSLLAALVFVVALALL